MNQKIILSSFVLLLFAIAAGGSINGDDIGNFFIIILVVVGVIAVGAIIANIVQNQNKKKRLELIKEDEQHSKDIDRSLYIGDDRCKIYFDATQKKVMIMRVMTEGIKKVYVEDFDFPGKSLANYHSPYFNVYDSNRRKLLSGSYNDFNIDFTVTDMSVKDKNSDVEVKNTIIPTLLSHSTTKTSASASVDTKYYNILIDEARGFMAITESGKFKQAFNYINTNSLPQKIGSKSYITTTGIGNYKFIMDDFFKVLVIITHSSYELFNYSDIIEVSYEENGNQLYTKSAARTVGGAVVGGVLMGGAGAVVGGLSGASKQNKEIKNMDIKILLRNTSRTSCVLNFKAVDKVLVTKNDADRQLYEKYLKHANQAKDTLAVIIDNAKQVNDSSIKLVAQVPTTLQTSIADELAKLAKLKADGILTDEEFQMQKSKLLGL